QMQRVSERIAWHCQIGKRHQPELLQHGRLHIGRDAYWQWREAYRIPQPGRLQQGLCKLRLHALGHVRWKTVLLGFLTQSEISHASSKALTHHNKCVRLQSATLNSERR